MKPSVFLLGSLMCGPALPSLAEASATIPKRVPWDRTKTYRNFTESHAKTKLTQEMLAVAAFSDWNPSHFLDVAEMTLAMAVGYDWMFDALDETSRGTIREAIKYKGVSLPFETKHNKWVTASNNWGQVCHCGLTAPADGQLRLVVVATPGSCG